VPGGQVSLFLLPQPAARPMRHQGGESAVIVAAIGPKRFGVTGQNG
jgi:hypothetical protein